MNQVQGDSLNIKCPICDAHQDLSSIQPAGQITQTICHDCRGNLVLVTTQEPVTPKALISKRGSKSTRTKMVGSVTLVLLCLLNYTVLTAGIFGIYKTVIPLTTTMNLPPELFDHTPAVTTLEAHTITEQLQALDLARNNGDIEEIAVHLSHDAIIEGSLHLPPPNADKIYAFDRNQYQATIRETYAQAQDYLFRRAISEVSVAGDGNSALVASHTVERMTMSGQTTTVNAQETIWFTLRDGRSLITKIHADGNVTVR